MLVPMRETLRTRERELAEARVEVSDMRQQLAKMPESDETPKAEEVTDADALDGFSPTEGSRKRSRGDASTPADLQLFREALEAQQAAEAISMCP